MHRHYAASMKLTTAAVLANPPPVTASGPDSPIIAAVAPLSLVANENPYTCLVCKLSFKTYPRLWMHAKRHNKHTWEQVAGPRPIRFPSQTAAWCPVAGCKRSREGSSRADDKRSVNNKRPFPTLACARAHYLRKHATDKKYVCDKCSHNKRYMTAKLADFKYHQQNCGKQVLVWKCGNPSCRTLCSSKKAMKRHCKHFGCPLPDPMVGIPISDADTQEETPSSSTSAAHPPPKRPRLDNQQQPDLSREHTSVVEIASELEGEGRILPAVIAEDDEQTPGQLAAQTVTPLDVSGNQLQSTTL